ncbi:MAG: single-stranded DNA-binding protein [Gammaproteobacteria bacterium]|nr:single-stranded DNA-binding protein [Gammaproteobacteria bacterium]MCY4200524.1 single-stranded DNA-binding protein [Gammaproteobacteria bacterium]MCY4276628.1 single-stranded DNA-binding protein [Gammaproteobacteria bacterium]MCY4323138.1 single-stranded DNA-binding protein [Gammaproteobacteria bacterium]
MARGINKVILIGHLGQDPQVRHTQENRPVTRLRVATSDSWRDRATGERRESTEWHTVVCFGPTAEFAEQYLRKGRLIYVEGSLRTSSFEREGVKQYNTEVIARTVNTLDSRRAAESEGSGFGDHKGDSGSYSPSHQSSRGQEPQAQPDSSFEDDIPF